MKKTLITPDLSEFPSEFHSLFTGKVFDSSCSPEARVYYIADKHLFLKKSPLGTLKSEAVLTDYFGSIGLGAEVLSYISDEHDWLLTSEVKGEDLTHENYLSRPAFLAEKLGVTLKMLHSLPTDGCPVNRTESYLKNAEYGYKNKRYDDTLFPDNWGYTSPESAWRVIEKRACELECNTLLHGDYCLPNIMFNGDSLSGFIDVGNGGIGDRHIDLFWGAWTLQFNLKTDKYKDIFFDAYGRKNIDFDRFSLIAACEVFG